MVYDGEQIAYEQQLRLDGANNQTGTAVISDASILCALPEAATSCRITTRWYTPSDITDDMIAATPDVASAPAGTLASPTRTGGTIPQGTSAPSAASYAYHTDHQGSVRAITDDAGQIVNAYAYDAYGNPEEAVESLTQPYRYTGREWDGVARTYHYRARAYDAETGRFLQEDPIWFEAGDLNVYRYVGNNPVNATDPSGMAAIENVNQMGIAVRVLTAGRMATQSMLSTGARTARYIESIDKNVLSAIAATITCTLFTLADALNQSGPNTEIVGIDPTRCGVVAMSVPDDIPLFLTIKKPITIPNKSSCQKHLTLCMENTTWRRGNVFGTGQCVTCFDVCKNTGLWPYSTPTGSCNYPGFIDD